jgi:hypothetical protein
VTPCTKFHGYISDHKATECYSPGEPQCNVSQPCRHDISYVIFSFSKNRTSVIDTILGHAVSIYTPHIAESIVIPVHNITASQICSLMLHKSSRPLGIQEAPRCFRQSAHEGGKVVNPTHRTPLPTRKDSWYSFLLDPESTPGP